MMTLPQYIESYFGIKGRSGTSIEHLFVQEEIDKNVALISEGEHVKKLYFLREGYIRMFRYDLDKSKEVTQWIASKDHFFTDASVFVNNTPARYSFTTLTPCCVYSISVDNYRKIHSFVPSWHELERLFLIKCFTTMEARIYNLISKTAAEKYKECMELMPDLFHHVPHQYIASMLGMTPETLSRMKSNSIS